MRKSDWLVLVAVLVLPHSLGALPASGLLEKLKAELDQGLKLTPNLSDALTSIPKALVLPAAVLLLLLRLVPKPPNSNAGRNGEKVNVLAVDVENAPGALEVPKPRDASPPTLPLALEVLLAPNAEVLPPDVLPHPNGARLLDCAKLLVKPSPKLPLVDGLVMKAELLDGGGVLNAEPPAPGLLGASVTPALLSKLDSANPAPEVPLVDRPLEAELPEAILVAPALPNTPLVALYCCQTVDIAVLDVLPALAPSQKLLLPLLANLLLYVLAKKPPEGALVLHAALLPPVVLAMELPVLAPVNTLPNAL